MKKMLPLSVAVNGTIIILSSIVLFHFLVLTGIVPFTIVWGGNLSDKTQLYTLETVSMAINSVLLFIVLIYAAIIKIKISRKFIIGVIWFMALLFLLNTAGNLMAKNSLEIYLFTPLTLMLSLFCFRIAAFEYQQKKAA